MGVKKKPTLKILFRQFAISLIVMLVAAIIVPSGLEGLAVNAGLATRANLSELQVKEIIPTLTIAPDITKVVIPQNLSVNEKLNIIGNEYDIPMEHWECRLWVLGQKCDKHQAHLRANRRYRYLRESP